MSTAINPVRRAPVPNFFFALGQKQRTWTRNLGFLWGVGRGCTPALPPTDLLKNNLKTTLSTT